MGGMPSSWSNFNRRESAGKWCRSAVQELQPIGSSAILLAVMIALVQSHGTSVYTTEALQEVDQIQLKLAEDLQKQFFMLRQLEEEAERAEKKAFVTDVLSNLNLHMVFPVLTGADQKTHQTALENLNDEALTDPNAALYGKDDMLPIDDWRPRKMTRSQMMTYVQMVKMTESVLRDFRTWIYKQYGCYMTMLQICIVML